MIQAPFDEAKPAKTWDEYYETKKEKTKEKLMKIEDKSHNLAHRIDRKILKSKTFGGLWKKVTGAKEDLDLENCQCQDCIDKKLEEERIKRETVEMELGLGGEYQGNVQAASAEN